MARDHLFEQQSEAMLKHVEDRAVAILVTDEAQKPTELGSGTCIRICNRYFIATAGHVVKDVPDRQIGILMWRDWGRHVPRILDRNVSGGDPMRRVSRDFDSLDAARSTAWFRERPASRGWKHLAEYADGSKEPVVVGE